MLLSLPFYLYFFLSSYDCEGHTDSSTPTKLTLRPGNIYASPRKYIKFNKHQNEKYNVHCLFRLLNSWSWLSEPKIQASESSKNQTKKEELFEFKHSYFSSNIASKEHNGKNSEWNGFMCLVICFGGANNSKREWNFWCALCEMHMCVSYIAHTYPNVNAFPHSRWYVVCCIILRWYYYFTRALSSILFIKMHFHNPHIPKQPCSTPRGLRNHYMHTCSKIYIAILSFISKLFASSTVSYCHYCLNFRFWLFFFSRSYVRFLFILLGVYGRTFGRWENEYEIWNR